MNLLLQKTKDGQYVKYTYDDNGNVLTCEDNGGVITYEYNIDNTIKKQTYPDGKSINYTSYDDNKQLLSMTDYFGNITDYTYNARGQITSIGEKYTYTSDKKTTNYTYDDSGALIKTVIPNNMTTEYTYDYAGRVTYLDNDSPYVNTYFKYNYTYDNSGNIIKSVDNVGGNITETNYSYDSVNRLSEEDGDTWFIYSYDQYNNLVSEIGQGDNYYYYDANNRLTNVAELWCNGETTEGEKLDDWESAYTYDNNGNLLSSSKESSSYESNQRTYKYDAWNRLTDYSDSLGETASYTYYADSLRKSKTVGTKTNTYYYNGQNIINEKNSQNEDVTYVMGVDGYISRNVGDFAHYYFKNLQGDVIYAFTSGKWRSSQYDNGAWGDDEFSYDYYTNDPNPIRYRGEYLDAESNMTYLRARYYDSHTRRFISEDPIKDGLNWYSYCSNNPVMFVDPSGLSIKIEDNQEVFLDYLNLLSRDTISIDGNGYAYISHYNLDASDRGVGTELIYQIITSEYTCYLREGSHNITSFFDPVGASSYGSDAFVNIQFIERDSVMVFDDESVYSEEQPVQFALGHELIHALRAMHGNRKADSIGATGIIKGTGEHFDAGEEELDTVGIQYINKWGFYSNADEWYFTENSLRREHGYHERVKYK